MTNYYVSTEGDNEDDGSHGKPWRTINHAVKHPSLQPGDTICVRGGTYYERVRIRSRSGSAIDPISMVAADGAGTVVMDGQYALPTGTSVSDVTTKFTAYDGKVYSPLEFVYSGLLQFSGVSHWVIEGISVINSRGRGVVCENSKDISFDSVRVDGCRNAMFWTNGERISLSNSLLRDGGNYVTVSRNGKDANWPVGVNMIGAKHVVITDCEICHHWGEGIGTGRDSDHIVISDNTIYDNMAMDLYVHISDNCHISGNHIYRTATDKYNRGDTPPSCVVFNIESRNFPDSGGSQGIQFINNLVHGDGNYALDLWNNQGGGAETSDVLIAHNTIVNQPRNGKRGAALHSNTDGSTYRNVTVRNNIFYSQGVDAFDGKAITSNFGWGCNLWSSVPPLSMRGGLEVFDNPEFVVWPVSPGAPPESYKKADFSPGVMGGFRVDGAGVDFFGVERVAVTDIGFDQVVMPRMPDQPNPLDGVIERLRGVLAELEGLAATEEPR